MVPVVPMLIQGPAVAVYAVRAEELLAGYSVRVVTDTFREHECSPETVGGVCCGTLGQDWMPRQALIRRTAACPTYGRERDVMAVGRCTRCREEGRFAMVSDGDEADALTDSEQARWVAARTALDDLMRGLAAGTIDNEGVTAYTRQLAQLDLDLEQVRDSLHVPSDAGPYREALIAILLRIPERWGRWLSCDAGWYPLLAALDVGLAALDPDYVLHQAKEKFATLRYYAHTDNDAVRAEFDALIAEAERRSATICERCGAEGSLCTKPPNWVKTLCHGCRTDLGYEPKA